MIELLITLLVFEPLTSATSVKIVRSPLTPSWTTLLCPFGRFASYWVTVPKGIASVVTFNSGLFSTNILSPVSGVVLYWNGVVGLVPNFLFPSLVEELGKVSKSLRVK